MTSTGTVIKMLLQLITALAVLPALPSCYFGLVGISLVALLRLLVPLIRQRNKIMPLMAVKLNYSLQSSGG